MDVSGTCDSIGLFTLLAEIAERGKMVCDHIAVRKLWYAGMVEWCSPAEVRLTSAGLAALYREEEEKQRDREMAAVICSMCHRRQCKGCAFNLNEGEDPITKETKCLVRW